VRGSLAWLFSKLAVVEKSKLAFHQFCLALQPTRLNSFFVTGWPHAARLPHFFTYYFNIMINQRGKAVWNGDMKGHGTISTQSGVVEAQYSVGSRFEGQKGTNPEELIGAAHAGCYTMFLTNVLGQHGHTVETITTTSTVTLDPTQNPPKITKIHVSTEGKVTGGNITPEDFQKHAEFAKANCPVSQVLSAVPEMTLEAKLS
jgi:osmotically inducible protein OsmC